MRTTWAAASILASMCAQSLAVAGPANPPNPDTTAQCIAEASTRHAVNPDLLTAILRVESNLRPDVVRRNTNGSVDVGIAQINSVHFKSLKGYGIEPGHLLDPCVGTFVAAWHLRSLILKYGNTWFAVGAYNSVTARHNVRYQQLVYMQLNRMGQEKVSRKISYYTSRLALRRQQALLSVLEDTSAPFRLERGAPVDALRPAQAGMMAMLVSGYAWPHTNNERDEELDELK